MSSFILSSKASDIELASCATDLAVHQFPEFTAIGPKLRGHLTNAVNVTPLPDT